MAKIDGRDPVRWIEGELEREPELWDDALTRKALFKGALVVGVGGSALLNSASALARTARPAVKTTMVAAQRIPTPTLNVDVPGFRSEIILSCYPGLVDVHVPADYETARKQLATKGVEYVPMLAKSWKASKDRMTWTFDLQPTAKSFYGNQLQVLDLQWSVDKWTVGSTFVAPGLARLLGITNGPQQVKALTPTRARVTLTQAPPSFFLGILALPFVAIYDSTEIKKHVTSGDPWGNNWLRNNTAGFGPYHVQSVTPTGDQTILVANPGYWGAPKAPPIKKITRVALPESSSRLQLLLSGQADLADELTPVELDSVAKSANSKVTVFATARTIFIAMNNSKPPWNDPAIRRGLAQAISYDAILKYVYRGRAKRWKTVIVPYFPGATDQYWKYDQNIPAAKQALAGIKDTLTLNYPIGSPADEQVAIIAQQGLKVAGLKINIQALDPNVYNTKKNTGQLDFYTDAQDTPIVADAVFDMNRYYSAVPTQDGIIHYAHNDAVSSLMKQAIATTDIDKVVPLVKQLQSILVPQMPIIPIAWTGNQSSHVKTLAGIIPHGYTFAYFQDMFFTK